jgi:hypothetical protein
MLSASSEEVNCVIALEVFFFFVWWWVVAESGGGDVVGDVGLGVSFNLMVVGGVGEWGWGVVRYIFPKESFRCRTGC